VAEWSVAFLFVYTLKARGRGEGNAWSLTDVNWNTAADTGDRRELSLMAKVLFGFAERGESQKERASIRRFGFASQPEYKGSG
jgi:hypothetical protein